MLLVDPDADVEASARGAAVFDAHRVRRHVDERRRVVVPPAPVRLVRARGLEGRDQLRPRPDGEELTRHRAIVRSRPLATMAGRNGPLCRFRLNQAKN
jgi:hypothetical protein